MYIFIVNKTYFILLLQLLLYHEYHHHQCIIYFVISAISCEFNRYQISLLTLCNHLNYHYILSIFPRNNKYKDSHNFNKFTSRNAIFYTILFWNIPNANIRCWKIYETDTGENSRKKLWKHRPNLSTLDTLFIVSNSVYLASVK